MRLNELLLPRNVGFLNVVLGGLGRGGGIVFSDRYAADGEPFAQRLVHLDTDPVTSACFDEFLCLALDGGKVRAMQADPTRFAPEVAVILQQYAEMLHPEDILNGSRTIRALTQLAFAWHEETVARMLRKAIHDLVRRNSLSHIVPVLASSTGGGAGSALQILLMARLSDPQFRNVLLEGLSDDLLQRPISFVAEPFALALRHPTQQHNRILANAFAFRAESEALERAGCTKYLFHLAFSNPYGVVLDDPDQIAWTLGSCVFEFERNFEEFKARFVDTVDVSTISTHYAGRDVPDLHVATGNGRKE